MDVGFRPGCVRFRRLRPEISVEHRKRPQVWGSAACVPKSVWSAGSVPESGGGAFRPGVWGAGGVDGAVAYGGLMLRRLIARAYWSLSRWNLVTEPAPTRPTVLIGAPHTSNWDFVFMLGIAWRLGIDVRWLGKHTLFTGWRGPIMRGLGGVPVDRSDPSRIVEETVERIRDGEIFGLVVTPDGTRRGHSRWKSGFYRIARETGMPVTLGYVDRTTMTTGLGPTLELTGDVAADMDRIRAFYADKSGFHPQHRVEPRLQSEPEPEP